MKLNSKNRDALQIGEKSSHVLPLNFKLITYNYSSGQAMITAVIFFLFSSLIIMNGVSTPVVREVMIVNDLVRSKEGLFAAEGGIEDVIYRLKNGITVSSSESVSLNNSKATTTITDVTGGKTLATKADRNGFVRNMQATLTQGSGASFNYGVQSGIGGVLLENSSSIAGNVYSNGPVEGSGSNLILGDVVSAGPSGLVKNIHATSSVYAHTIENADIDKDAYYVSISNTTVDGVTYPGSTDQATTTMPISDSMVASWESDAQAGGVISSPCPYKITDDMTIGPKKINCDLEISGDPVVTLAGNLWVVGNVTIQNTAIVNVSSSLGSNSVAIIADKASDRDGGSKILLQNTVEFQGSGQPNSYILFISQNNDAENGGNNVAIDAKNSVNGKVLLYASHGEISLQNSIIIKEVTAYRLRLKNSASVIYETGIANLLFSSGPSGGYSISSWGEN